MAFSDIFKARSYEPALNVPLESPWADNSHLETLTLANLYGVEPDTLPLTREGALSIAAVAKGRGIIVSSIARLPLIAVKGGTPIDSQPPLLGQLEQGTTNFQILSYTVDSMIFYGRAYWLITERALDGRPRSVQYVPEDQLETDKGRLIKAFGKPVKPADYIRFDANHSGLLHYGKDVLRTAKEIERAAAEAGASPVPSVVLQQKEGSQLSQAEVAEMLARWSAARRRRFGSVAFASSDIEPVALGASAEDLLIAGMNQSAVEIARALGLPSFCVDANIAGQSLNYQNAQSRNREILEAINPYIEAVQQTLSLYMPYGTEVVFDTAEMLRPDTKSRYEEYEIALRAGFLTVDEIRAKENLAPLPEEQKAPVPEPVQDTTEEEPV